MRDRVNNMERARIREGGRSGRGITLEVLTVADVVAAKELSVLEDGTIVKMMTSTTDKAGRGGGLGWVSVQPVNRGTILMVRRLGIGSGRGLDLL